MSEKIKENQSPNIMTKIATFIVDKRNLFFLLFIFAGIFSIISSGWVDVENDITAYLSSKTETKAGLELMNKEFVTYATADIMVTDISYERACKIKKDIAKINGISSVEFANNDKHFKGTEALFSITFDSTESDKKSLKSLNKIKAYLSDYNIYVSSAVGNSASDTLQSEMNIILVIAAIIIVVVLLFTSHSYAEVPVLLITFATAALLSKGTNFIFGKISFISDSVSVVLQLALAIDYAIILCHRYTEEREHLPQREAVIVSLSKAIPEIASSSLTTVSGLAALITMQFGIGRDMGIVMIKAIVFSLLAVFTLMPGLLMIFGEKMQQTVHKNFIPRVDFIGRFDIKTKKIIPPIFLGLMIVAFFLSANCLFCYNESSIPTIHKNAEQIAREKIASSFRQTNRLAIIVPSGNYKKEAAFLKEIEKSKNVESTVGLANTEALNGYTLTDKISPREFGELADVDYEAAKLLYAAYAAEHKEYGQIVGNLDSYKLPIIDTLTFLDSYIEKGYLDLDSDIEDKVHKINDEIQDAKLQLRSKNYTRMIVDLNIPDEGKQTFEYLDEMHTILKKYYPKDTYFVGNAMSNYDLEKAFSRDNIIISILSALFVIIILFFTFKSAGMPVLLIAVIQGSIWINFSVPAIMRSKLFFLGYLVVTSIQMGANIDYAIVISSRYNDLKQKMNINDAMIETINAAFPTIITSGTMLSSAGILIGFISTNPAISSLGLCLGRGTIISIVLVLAVLPQIILIGNSIIERTAYTVKKPDLIVNNSGGMLVNGRVIGKVNGIIDAEVHGIIHGDVNAVVTSGSFIPSDSLTAEAKELVAQENPDQESAQTQSTIDAKEEN